MAVPRVTVTCELFGERRGTEQVDVEAGDDATDGAGAVSGGPPDARPDGPTAADVVRALGWHPEAHLVIRGETPLALDAPVEDGDELKVLRIVSGGRGGRDLHGSGPR